jgi:putative transposase
LPELPRTARFAWNWALAEWNRQYEAGEKPTALKLKKQFDEIRREQFPWTWERRRRAFFEGKHGRPTFKSKKQSKPSF